MSQLDEHGLRPDGEPSGEAGAPTGGARFGLRSRMLGAILVVALTTVGVGAFGIQRMSVMSDQAQRVYDEGAVPLDGLRQLQVDWWAMSASTARANIAALSCSARSNAPPALIECTRYSAASMSSRASDVAAASSRLPCVIRTRSRHGTSSSLLGVRTNTVTS